MNETLAIAIALLCMDSNSRLQQRECHKYYAECLLKEMKKSYFQNPRSADAVRYHDNTFLSCMRDRK